MAEPYNYMIDVPDPTESITKGIQRGLKIANLVDNFKMQKQQREQQSLMQDELASLSENPTTSNIAKMMVKYPNLSEPFKRTYDVLDAEQQKERLGQASKAYSALKSNKPEIAISYLNEQALAYENANRYQDAKALRDLSKMIEISPETAATSTGLFLANAMGVDKFTDTFTKLEKEQREAISFPVLKAQKQAELNKAKSDSEVAEIEAKYAEQIKKAHLAKAKRDIETQSGERVQSSSIRPDGTVVMVTSGGATRVISPEGVELTGQARIDAVRGAEEFGADVEALRSGSRKAAEIGQAEAKKAFDSVGKIRKNISNLDSAIAALDAGANTGVISSKFPNWKASTIELQNIQRQLGLDIIGAVSFGALSEGELSLALETALPINMKEEDLKNWLASKKKAQEKLSDYITDQARFLSVPGRTLGDWLERADQKGGVNLDEIGSSSSTTQGPIKVSAPNGQVFIFKDQQSAEAFTKAVGAQ